MVFDDTTTFSRTIRENIALGRPGARIDEIKEAARLAQAAEFIERLPARYDTQLGEQGLNLSGGQRQRLALARAILQQPRVLILDDATSALDPGTQVAVVEALRTVLSGRTVLVIAHRPETVALADAIAVVDGGRVVAMGPRLAMESEPAYRAALGLDGARQAG
jgi:ATP-binding cassette subfamily B protein